MFFRIDSIGGVRVPGERCCAAIVAAKRARRRVVNVRRIGDDLTPTRATKTV
jgi:hypothetical protein